MVPHEGWGALPALHAGRLRQRYLLRCQVVAAPDDGCEPAFREYGLPLGDPDRRRAILTDDGPPFVTAGGYWGYRGWQCGWIKLQSTRRPRGRETFALIRWVEKEAGDMRALGRYRGWFGTAACLGKPPTSEMSFLSLNRLGLDHPERSRIPPRSLKPWAYGSSREIEDQDGPNRLQTAGSASRLAACDGRLRAPAAYPEASGLSESERHPTAARISP